MDLVIIIPKFLRWMVPDGVASIWTVDIPLRQGSQWNETIAEAVQDYFQNFDECYLSIALSHPDPSDFDIERFTSITPFEINKWQNTSTAPSITFILRNDRLWTDGSDMRFTRFIYNRLWDFGADRKMLDIKLQKRNVIMLAELLKSRYPGLNFNVVGIGEPGGLPSWISDLRVSEINDTVEKNWCTVYAESDVVIGIHGSNMLLPSALSGSTIELVPADRWTNIYQDIIISDNNVRISMARIRMLNMNTPPSMLATAVENLYRYMPVAVRNYSEILNNHEYIRKSPYTPSRMHADLSSGSVGTNNR